MALINSADLEARIGRSLTSEEANAFAIINNSNQAYVERMIGSSLEDVSPATRYYDGGVQHLTIDPCTSITSVKLVDDDENLIDNYDTSDYTVEPRSRTLKTMLRHRSGRFTTGMNNISVTAKFSIYDDADVSAIIKDALLSAVENEVNNTSNIKQESIEGYSVTFADSQTKDALDKLKFLFPGV